MKRVLAAAGLAAVMVAGAAAPSRAAIVGAVDPTSLTFAGVATTTGPNATAIDYFSFAIPLDGSYTFSASVTTAPTSKVTFSAFSFYDSAFTAIGPAGVATNNKNYNIDAYTFTKKGIYYVGVTETALSAPSYNRGISGDLAVSSVPLPNSVAMFGAAIAGLGVAGAVGRKVRKSATTAA